MADYFIKIEDDDTTFFIKPRDVVNASITLNEYGLFSLRMNYRWYGAIMEYHREFYEEEHAVHRFQTIMQTI